MSISKIPDDGISRGVTIGGSGPHFHIFEVLRSGIFHSVEHFSIQFYFIKILRKILLE